MQVSTLLLPVTFLLITSTSVVAQSEADPTGHFSIGVSGGLTIDQWHLNSTELFGEEVAESSPVHLGYFGNVSGAYTFGKHWKLKVAAEIHSRKLEYRLDGLHFYQDFNGTGFNDSHLIYNTAVTTFNVPVTVEYIFGSKRVLPFFSLGMATEFVLKETLDGTIYYSDGTTERVASEDILKTSFAALAGTGIYYKASGRISLSIGTAFSYSLQKYSFNRHQYSFGFATGIFYAL